MPAPRAHGPRLLAATILIGLVGSACGAGSQADLAVQIYDGLVAAHTTLAKTSDRGEPCNALGDIRARLYGDAKDLQAPALWMPLRRADESLLAVCGQAFLLALPGAADDATASARTRWTEGIRRGIEDSCQHLGEASRVLKRPPPAACR